MSAEDIWRQKSDEEVFAALDCLAEYTETGRRIILDEAQRRRPEHVRNQDQTEEQELLADRVPCPYCKESVHSEATVCPHCRRSIESKNPGANALNRQMLGFIGAAVLFVGVFMPIASMPIVGSINYFQNGRGDGTFVLGFALLALLFVVRHLYELLWIPGLGSLGVLAFTFANLQAKLAEMHTSMSRELADNPFRGIAEAITGTFQLQWGWAVLVVGSVVLLIAAFSKQPVTSRVARSPDEVV